ncbi:MAG: hypothetical protein NVS9B1_27270 [Candidatus Dormibacteraceae bacterium]
MIEGLDVSVYQSTTPPLTGLGFLFAKATEGTGYVDPTYTMHVANAERAGLVVGAYHFGIAGDPAGQAAHFLATIGAVRMLALDFERANPQMSQAEGRAFIAAVHAAGYRIGLYAPDSGFPDLGQDWNWVASYDYRPTRPMLFWQYTSKPNLDRDHFYGTLAELRALAGKDATVQTTFVLPSTAKVGSLTVAGNGHYYLRLQDGVLQPAPAGWVKAFAIGPVTLKPPIPGGAAGADRSTAYLVGDDAAAFLASDVTFTPAPADTAPAVNAALDHVLAAVTDVGKAIQEARPR